MVACQADVIEVVHRYNDRSIANEVQKVERKEEVT